MGDLGERFWAAFVACSLVCAALVYFTRCSTKAAAQSAASDEFLRFQRMYLLVYLLAMFADWLQGPYVYQLYISYGYTDTQIAELFIAGFLSSMLFGTITASLADKWGRKFMSIAYAVMYILACLTKLCSSFWLLMLGRLFSGIATSLLFAVFESWMVCEHTRRGFDPQLLSQTFGLATFGNGLCAIVAGLVANLVSNQYGYVAPFVVALVPLALLIVIVGKSWNENYGDKDVQPFNSFVRAVDVVRKDTKIMALGAAQALFEGAMYCFVLMWTPVLREQAGEESSSDYLGLIFSAFMVCMMIGSMVFELASSDKNNRSGLLPFGLHALACVVMLAAAVDMGNKTLVLGSFLVFEATVGMFYPAYGQIKSLLIPEEVRSSVMTLFRVPLNMLVMIVLLKVEALSLGTVLLICAAAHGVSLMCFAIFHKQHNSKRASQYSRLENADQIELKGSL